MIKAKLRDNLKHGFIYWKKSNMREIPISSCIHYCGFKYGNQSYNPYESYTVGLANGQNIIELRKQFIRFLQYYRPHTAARALDITTSKNIAMWTYPWNKHNPSILFDTSRFWFDDFDSISDLLTHFTERGILSYRIDEEFMWLERSLYLINEHGYLPDKYNYVTALQLHGKSDDAYILLDGNHRVSAFTALGMKTVVVKIPKIINEQDCESWPAVKSATLSTQDALAIFHAYFKTNSNYVTTSVPAKIIAPQEWGELYSLLSCSGNTIKSR